MTQSDEQETAGAVQKKFGTLSKVEARSPHGWSHEEHDFTPWLAKSLDLLGQELGLDLELKKREHRVGNYRLDLLLEDSAGRVVIVENQFGKTDHDHLGKLLTYAAGTEADVVIWVAEKLNNEHIAALEWLNDQTIEGVGFFGVELELLRIDDSKAAPHFRVVVQPNEWVKEARSANPKTPPVSWSWEKFERVLGISTAKIELAQAICAESERIIAERELPWKQYFGKGFVTYKRPGEYNVLDIDLKWHNPVRFAVKLPESPEDLNLLDPFPTLQSLWLPKEREWGWTIPAIEAIPDLSGPIELSAAHQPPTGPMKAL